MLIYDVHNESTLVKYDALEFSQFARDKCQLLFKEVESLFSLLLPPLLLVPHLLLVLPLLLPLLVLVILTV